jgi:hypothetical protein
VSRWHGTTEARRTRAGFSTETIAESVRKIGRTQQIRHEVSGCITTTTDYPYSQVKSTHPDSDRGERTVP